MKVIKLSCENVKKLRAVEITPTGDLVEITGRNGSGKSSVLDSLFWAIAGAKHIQSMPIRKGQKTAHIRLDLGELIVERHFSASGSTLTVESAQGARYKSPQAMLDALLGALTFDPLGFVGEDPRKQFETLRSIVPLDVDVDQLDGLNAKDYDGRTEINRQAKALRVQADVIAVPEGLPEAPIDTSALMDRMAEASKVNAEIGTRRVRREQAAKDVQDLGLAAAEKLSRTQAVAADCEARIVKAEAQIDLLVAEIAALRHTATTQSERLTREAAGLQEAAALKAEKLAIAAPLPEPVDVDAIRAEVERGQRVNRSIEQRAKKVALLEEAEQREEEARELTARMEAREQAKADAIATAAMPVEGLGFGDGIVTFGGLPFDQASTAEQLRVSVAIAMAANPKLKVLRIKEGSLLDADNVALIAEMAREHDYQVWLETVSSDGRPAIVIEDGSVKEIRGAPP